MGLRDTLVRYLNLGPQLQTNKGTHPSLQVGKIAESFYPEPAENPFWFGDIQGNHLPNLGFTYRPYDVPAVKFHTQKIALETDEDVQIGIDTLASHVSGGDHFWKAKTEKLSKHMLEFSKLIHFDEIDTIIAKEMLWFGNSFWRFRKPVEEITGPEDLMHLPISSMARIWWDRERIPRVYEFRGAEFNGYFRWYDIIHFKWNPINASAFGLGFGAAACSRVLYQEDTPDGPRDKTRESLLSMKYGIQNTFYKAAKRYVTRIIYQALNTTPDERTTIKDDLKTLDVGEDFVVGKAVTPIELGTATRNFDPTAYNDLIIGQLLKALQNFRGKQAGESQHTFANAEQASILDEVGLAPFPTVMKLQMVEKIFKPWYAFNQTHDTEFGGGLVMVPWEFAEFELNFGKLQQKNLTPEQTVALLGAGSMARALKPIEVRENLEKAGIIIKKELTEQIMNENLQQDMNSQGGQQEDQSQVPGQQQDQQTKETIKKYTIAKTKFLESLANKHGR